MTRQEFLEYLDKFILQQNIEYIIKVFKYHAYYKVALPKHLLNIYISVNDYYTNISFENPGSQIKFENITFEKSKTLIIALIESLGN